MNGRTYSVRMEGAKYGVSFGSALAIAISYTTNHSIVWAIIHGVFSWLYVVYFALFRTYRPPFGSVSLIAALGSRSATLAGPLTLSRSLLTLERRKLHRWQPALSRSLAVIPCCSEEDMVMAVDINSCLSSDLISLRSIPKPIGRTDQLPETGAAAIEPGVDADRAGPPAEIAVPIWLRVYPGL